MKTGYWILLGCAAMGALRAQQPAPALPIPIRTLSPPSATSKETVGSIMGLKHLPDGRVLINDCARRRLIVFDHTLSSHTIVADSGGTGAKAYPRQAARLFVPYLADTTLLADVGTAVFLVIGPDGTIARTMAPVRVMDVRVMSMFGAGVPGIDGRGRWMFRAPFEYGPPRPAGAPPLPPATIDSAKRIVDSVTASGGHYTMTLRATLAVEGRTVVDTVYPEVRFVPIKDIADYVPPIRSGALKPDLDGNLWILPTTSAQATGGLLYDVVNRKGEIVERVQLPRDRDTCGFARGGVVYLSRYDAANGYHIERTSILRKSPTRQ